jgi:DNA-binding NtrC family response regulator
MGSIAQKLLLVCESNDWAINTRNIVEQKLLCHVYQAMSQHDAEIHLENKVFNLAVVDFKVLNKTALEIIHWMQKSQYSFPILVITEKIEVETHMNLSLLNGIYLLIRPFSDLALVGLVRKLLSTKKVPKQEFRRFNTNQIIELEALGSGENMMTSMYNLSRGGAYCEFEANTNVSVGDVFRMKVFLTDTQTEYTFNAKIVWTTPSGRFSGRSGCGIKFVNKKDIYRSQLSQS